MHPEARALGACTRCGSFACVDCAVWRGDQLFCVRCEARTLRDASWLSIGAAIIGFLSVGCGPLGLLAVVLGAVDVVRIKLGVAPKDGARLDALGIGLGLLGLALGGAIAWRLTHGGTVDFGE